MPSERIDRLVGRFRSNRERLEAFCGALSDEELARPVPTSTWQVKDFISHLATLDTQSVRWFEALAKGDKDPSAYRDGTRFDIDEWNDEIVAKRRDRSIDQIFAEAAENRERFLTALEQLTDEQIERVVHFGGDNKRDPADIPFKLFLSGLTRHDPIHVADMLKALPERANEPGMQEWLDDPAVKWYQNAMSGPPKR
jgi:uncharacterized damage-inducible protein DinB